MRGYRYALQVKIPYGKITAAQQVRPRLNEPGIELALAEYQLSVLEAIRRGEWEILKNQIRETRSAYHARYYSEHKDQWKGYAAARCAEL